MMGDHHVQFYENLRLKCLGLLTDMTINNKVLVFLIFLFFNGYVIVYAQSYPVIGNPVPNFRLTNVRHYRSEIFDPVEEKSKWVILDFWNKRCSSCIKSFPKVSQLQSEFKDDVQFLIIGNNSTRKNLGIEQVYERYRKKYQLELATAYDTTLIDQFGIDVYPYIIVIDPQSIVYAITTGSDFLSRENIQALVDNKAPAFRRWYGNFEPRDSLYFREIAKWRYLVNEGDEHRDFLYRSILSESKGGYQQGSMIIDEHVKDGFYQITRVDPLRLFNIAYWGKSDWSISDPFYSDHWKYPLLEVSDSSDFMFSYGKNTGIFNYSLIAPKEKSTKEHLMEIMQRDLKSYFECEVSVETRSMPYWRLTATEEGRRNLKTKGETHAFQGDPTGIAGKGITIRGLLLHIEQYNSGLLMPFVDETNIIDEIDITCSAVMTDIKEVQKALRRNGLVLEKSEKKMKVLVITDPKSVDSDSPKFKE